MTDANKGALVAATFAIVMWLIVGAIIRPEWFGL